MNKKKYNINQLLKTQNVSLFPLKNKQIITELLLSQKYFRVKVKAVVYFLFGRPHNPIAKQ